MTNKWKSLLFATLLMTSTLFMSGVIQLDIEDTAASPQIVKSVLMMPSYTEHDTIYIQNNSHLQYLAQNESWGGDGSELSPFLIEGYNITSDALAIEINHVTLYVTIMDCYIDSNNPGFDHGIYLNNVSHCQINETIIKNRFYGINAAESPNLLISNCNISLCTNDNINLDGSPFVYLFENNFFESGNAGSALVDCPNSTIEFNNFFTNDYGLIMNNDDYTSISYNHFFNNSIYGLDSGYTEFAYIFSNYMYDNGEAGLALNFGDNTTIDQNEFYHNGWSGTPRGGLYAWNTPIGVVVTNNLFSNNSYSGIRLDSAAHWTISNNDIVDNGDQGIYGPNSDHMTVFQNSILNNGRTPEGGAQFCGVYIDHTSEYWDFDHNFVSDNAGYGFTNSGTNHTTYSNNEIVDNDDVGIEVSGDAFYITIYNNTITDHGYAGIHAEDSFHLMVTWNIIFENRFGILMNAIDNSTFYYNDIAWNPFGNVEDTNSFYNRWNISSVGNWYGDYFDTGNYTHSVTSIDYHPSNSLEISAADSIEYESGSTGNTLFWSAQALNPWYYQWHVNESYVDFAFWDGTDISIPVDGLDIGYNVIQVDVYHISERSTSAITSVNVTPDASPPEWVVIPEDFEVVTDSLFIYQFNATDPSGISGWSVNDSVHFTIDENGTLTNLMGLDAGAYGINVSCWDAYNNTLWVELTITALEPPADIDPPVWDIEPVDIVINEGEQLSVIFNATDPSGIGGYSVNNTFKFQIDFYGNLTNKTILEPGEYGLSIICWDVPGNLMYKVIKVTVIDLTPDTTTTTTPPPGDSGFLLILLLGGGAAVVIVILVVVVMKKKRS
ncbi:MAG: right-handed parallel beta-helix repeat-containing protein [Candidatus Thorarchaeota archaeon]